jgi:hypothetical protein
MIGNRVAALTESDAILGIRMLFAFYRVDRAGSISLGLNLVSFR